MDRIHARYPFFGSARAAVEAAAVDLAELVESGDRPVVERGRARVESALSEGHVGDVHRSTRVELLSYPVARVLVSELDEPMAVHAYARAEAATARQRFEVEVSEPDADGGDPAGRPRNVALTIDRLLAEFELDDAVAERDPFGFDVTTYLELSRGLDGDDWALVDRPLSDGRVPVERTELYDLLEQAVADRVAEGLPLSVPETVAEGLAEPVGDLEALLADHDVPLQFDAAVPEAFPPCIRALLERARDGDGLEAHSQYALVGFLGATGMDATALVELADDGLDRETVTHQLAHLRDDDGLEYAPPSCATMDAYGDCVNRDERCDTVNHPLAYYDGALAEQSEI